MIKPAHYSTLSGEEMEIAKLAQVARLDTINGGARAFVLAKKMPNLEWVVSDVYSRSTGKHSTTLEAWECPECGQSYLGQEKVFACCAEIGEEIEA